MTPPVLLPAELEALTGKVRPSAQARELERRGVPFLRRSNGTLVVWRNWDKPKQAPEPEEDWTFRRADTPRHPVYEGKGVLGWWNDNKERLCLTLDQLLSMRVHDLQSLPTTSGVYLIFYMDELQYVGQSRSIYQRVMYHWRYGQVAIESVVPLLCPELCMTWLELYYFDKFSPPLNYRRPQ